MARGFSTTLGVGTTDRIDSALTAHATTRTYAIMTNRNGDGGGGFGRMVNKTSADQMYFDPASGGTYNFVRNWSTAGIWTMPAPATGAWHSFIVTYNEGADTNDPLMYLDGVSQTVTEVSTPTGTVVTNANTYKIGNALANDRVWDGMLSEFAIWDRILTVGEIAALGKGYSPLLFPIGLAEYVPLLRDNVSRKLAAPTITGTAVQPHPRIIYPASQGSRFVPAAVAAGNPWHHYRQQRVA